MSIVEAVAGTPRETEDSTSAINASDLQQAVKAIADEISLLHELSNTIRKASREAANLKAAADFRIKDEEGNDLEPLLRQYFSANIRDRFPGCSDILLERLASTMVLRRKRILYRRHRYGKTPVRPTEPAPAPKIKDYGLQIIPVEGSNEAFQGLHQEGSQTAAETIRTAVETIPKSATTLLAAQYQQASTPSVVSGAETVALGAHEGLVFPRAPRGHIRERFVRLRKALLDQLGRDASATYLRFAPEQAEGKPSSSDDRWGTIRHNATLRSLQTFRKEAVEKLRKECYDVDVEVVCPFCLYTMSSLALRDEIKWRYVPLLIPSSPGRA